METKHTPGPWNVSTDGTIHEEDASWLVVAPDGGTVAMVNTVLETGYADASLIASAPDLLIERDTLRQQCDALIAELEHCTIGLNITRADIARLRDDLPTPITVEFNRTLAHINLWYDNLGKAELSARAALAACKKSPDQPG